MAKAAAQLSNQKLGRPQTTMLYKHGMRTHKYNAKRTVVDGHSFPSMAEAAHYGTLKQRLAAGEIRELRLQVPYVLSVNAVQIGRYLADFEYVECKTGEKITADVKGYRTPEYALKKRLMLACHGVTITEIKAR